MAGATNTNGLTSTTVKNLLLDAGAVYINYGELTGERLLGATLKGNKLTIDREIKEIKVDGAKGKVKGLERIVSENATLTVNLKEMSAENIKLALAGSTVADDTTHSTITSNGVLVDADYVTNIALIATVSGSTTPCVVILKNALNIGNFDISFEDKDEATVQLKMAAHYDPANLTEVPFEIRYPKIV